MRETMRKEIVSTKISYGKVENKGGKFSVSEAGELVAVGNLTTGNKALDHVKKTLGEGYTVFETSTSTQTYTASVEDFLKIAKPLEAKEEAEQPEPSEEAK